VGRRAWRKGRLVPSSCEVLGDGLDEVGRRHEDGEGADDGEEREGHQAQAVHHGRRKLPLAADGVGPLLVAEAPGDVLDLLQDARDLRHLLHQQSPRVLAVDVAGLATSTTTATTTANTTANTTASTTANTAANTTATAHHHPRVGAAGREGGVVRAHGVVAKVQVHAAVGGAGGVGGGHGVGGGLTWDGGHRDAVGAGVVVGGGGGMGVLVTSSSTTTTTASTRLGVEAAGRPPGVVLPGLLHAQEPSAPVEQDDSDLGGRGQVEEEVVVEEEEEDVEEEEVVEEKEGRRAILEKNMCRYNNLREG